MIAGRSRFYVVAGIVGAVLGESVTAVVAVVGLRLLASSSTTMMLWISGAPLVLGTVGGAFGGVAVLRLWYRRRDHVHTSRSGHS